MDFCTKCGARLENGACPNCDKPRQAAADDRYKRFFMNPKEEFVCALGNSFIQNYFASGFIRNGFAVVSDKRVYFNGKTYEVFGKKLRKTTESKTVDLKDVTGTSVRTIKYPLLLIIAIAYPITALVLYLITSITGVTSQLPELIGLIIVFIFLPSIGIVPGILLIIYNITNKSLLTINYAGGNIAFDISWYSSDESENFQKMLRQAKDAAVEEAENAAANAMREVMSGIAAPPVQAVQPQAAVVSADELAKYAQLFKDGMLSEEEFAEIKAKLLSK